MCRKRSRSGFANEANAQAKDQTVKACRLRPFKCGNKLSLQISVRSREKLAIAVVGQEKQIDASAINEALIDQRINRFGTEACDIHCAARRKMLDLTFDNFRVARVRAA